MEYIGILISKISRILWKVIVFGFTGLMIVVGILDIITGIPKGRSPIDSLIQTGGTYLLGVLVFALPVWILYKLGDWYPDGSLKYATDRRKRKKYIKENYTDNDNYQEGRTLAYSKMTSEEYNLENLYFMPVGAIKVSGDKRPEVVQITLNAELLRHNKMLVNSGQVPRDNVARKQSHVSGWDEINQEFFEVNGRNEAMWHRTHLLPFRFCLSEGQNFPYLLVAGTAECNSGDRPQYGFTIDPELVRRRVDNLFRQIVDNEREGIPFEDYITRPYPHKGDDSYPKSVQYSDYSMDDVERLADKLISYYKDRKFTYRATPEYKDGTTGVPSKIKVELYSTELDAKHAHLMFRAVIYNRT